jgi:hypothetical protein
MEHSKNFSQDKKAFQKKIKPSCDICEFFDYDEEGEEKVCCIHLDEDELAGYLSGRECPYFRFYDEYKSVQKQL